MLNPSSSESFSNDLSKLGNAAGITSNLTHSPYGLPVQTVSENLTVSGRDLVNVAFDAEPDHALKGLTRVNFAIKNQGSQNAGAFKADIVYSKDATIGNNDDIILKTISVSRLNAGSTLNRGLNVKLPIDELNGSAIKEDRPNRGNNYQSRNQDFLGLVIDPERRVAESNEGNNRSQKKGTGKDDITYFPWDINGNGTVNGADVQFVRNRLGRTGGGADPRADFDGDRAITQTDLDAVSDRVGYKINPKVTAADIFASQPRQNGQPEPVIEGVIADIGAVKTVRAKFLGAPKNSFTNITNDIKKAGQFSLNQNRLKAIYGRAFPERGQQRLRIETLDKRGRITKFKTISFKPETTTSPPTSPGVETPRPEPGNTTARAFNVRQLNGKRTFADSVSDTDRFDYYRFELQNTSDFSVGLNINNSRYDANVKIVDNRGNTVFNPVDNNSRSETGKTLLEKGVYYALVEEDGFNGSTGYRLTLEASRINNNRPSVDPGETTARAFNIGKLGETQTLKAFISDADPLDYYRFNLTKASNVTVDLDILNERYDADVKIVDAAGKTVFNPAEINFTDERETTLLEAGTYYAEVKENDFNDGTAYTLRLGATEITDNVPATDAGDTTARATDLGVLGATQTLNAFISDSDPLDYYRFELENASNVTIDLDILNERYDADVKIVNAAGATVFNPAEINFTDERESTFLEAGTYFAQVRENDFNDGTAYRLKLGATTVNNNVPPKDAGDTTARAFDLGALGNSQTVNAFISDADPLDYYRFELDQISRLTIDLDVLNERYDADVRIVDAAGKTVFNPAEINFTDERATTFLDAGTYFAQVRENDFNDGTAYRLKLDASKLNNNTPPSDPGETRATAYDLGTLSGTKRVRSFVSDSDALDYYQFRVNGTRNVRVNLNVINERYDANVKIVDSLGATIYSPPEQNFTDELGSVRLSQGIYYAVVSENDFDGGTEYLLSLGT